MRLKEAGSSLAVFSARVGPRGKARNYISEIADGRKTPSLQTAYDIWLATQGHVPMITMVPDRRHQEEARLSHIATDTSIQEVTEDAEG